MNRVFASRRLARLAATLVLAAAAEAGAQAPLSLAEAQAKALERSRQLAAQELAVTASREMAVAAGRMPDPVLSIGVENLPVEGADRFSFTRDSMTMRRIGLVQELTGSDKRALRAERFELEAQKGMAERDAAHAAIRRDTALAWLDAWYAEAMARVIAQQRLSGLQEVEAAEAAYRAGRGTQSDVFMARAGSAMIDDRAAELERQARASRAMLARWVGQDADRPLGAPPATDAVASGAHAVEELARHPQIVALERQEAIAGAEARLASANRNPDWSVGLAYNVRGSAFGDMVSIGVSVPLPWDRASRQDRELAAKLAVAAQAQAQRDESLRQHIAEVRVMVVEWESGRARGARYEREIVPLATARAEAALAAYRGGRSGVAEVIAARRGELEARLQALQLEAQTARLWAQLTYLSTEIAK